MSEGPRLRSVAMRGLFVLLVGTLAGAASGFTGCDPTEASFAVTLLNDTQRPLIANQCGNGCGSSATEKHTLMTGQSVAVNTSSENVDNWWRIATTSGRTVGCLDLLYDHKQSHVVVRLSAVRACPRS
jgi:uncharacterized protein YuzB (UPF0349 family)